ncbi:MAG: acetylxylan esterase [Planctomycetaceae bacterium]
MPARIWPASTVVTLFLLSVLLRECSADTLRPLGDNSPPQNLDELWAGYDPAREPLDVEVVREWKRGSTTVQMVVYTVGTFKGKKSRMGAYYAFPTQRQGRVPGLLQMHGGGQRAMSELVEAAAANGYACISMNWGGRPMADQQPGDPGTDWGAVDATQDGHNSHYGSLKPDGKTIDTVISPRNSNWFLIVVAARRALTFLQQQTQVDPERLGVTGHSMGGKLTVMTAGIDPRVRVAVPSCGGTAAAPRNLRERPGASIRPVNPEPLYYTTIDDSNYIRRITCPILYTGPQNDFNGILDNLYANWLQMPSRSVHYSISPHLNHRHVSESEFAGRHFLDVILKAEGRFPRTPQLQVSVAMADGIPQATLIPDDPDNVVRVDIYYSVDPHALTRFWRSASVARNGQTWSARCPVISPRMPLFVMANVYYPLEKEIHGPRWNRHAPQTFLVSSRVVEIDPPELDQADVRATDSTERMIESDFETWQDWYRLEVGNDQHRQCFTRKIKDPKWRGPDGATLAVDVLDPAGGELAVIFQMNSWNVYQGLPAGRYYAAKTIARSKAWQTIEITLADLVPLDERSRNGLRTWQYMTEVGIVAMVRTRENNQPAVVAGSAWPKSRKLKNLRWAGGDYPAEFIMPDRKISPLELERIFNSEIQKSVEQEKRDQIRQPQQGRIRR